MISGAVLTLVGVLGFGNFYSTSDKSNNEKVSKKSSAMDIIKLPQPITIGKMSVEEAIAKRRSIREYIDESLNLTEVSQLLWAAQGITDQRYGLRTAPSAGGTYPLEVYIAVRRQGIHDIEAGIYQYDPAEHALIMIRRGDFSENLMAAAVDQSWVAEAALNIIITGIFDRTTVKYGERGIQYVLQETGHVDENIYLMAIALGLGNTVIGAFHEEEIQRILGISKEERPLYVAPVGKTKCLGHPNQKLGFCESEPP